jgi:hypothetical protein
MSVEKQLEARMARIEQAVQRVQLFIALVTGVVAINACLSFAELYFPDVDLWMMLATRGGALLLGMLLAFIAAKIIGYPLQVLTRA